MKTLLILLLLPVHLFSQSSLKEETARWEKQAHNVTIIRDHWGIPHIYGKSDADAVFGLLYAQCEDDFKRVEMNYIEKLGRMSEVKGESSLFDDLRIRMIIDATDAKKDYERSPAWLKKLCQAFADAINFYLASHPDVKPALLTRFEPWFPLLWTDGSIGAIITADLGPADLKNLYGTGSDPVAVNNACYPVPRPDPFAEENATGSNGFAFSPRITESGKAILYINPHVTFYFRPEVHMTSEEGLNVYGAVTWGQFFIYQGFNEHCGWMHTSSGVDATDSYMEKLSRQEKGWVYEYEGKSKTVTERKIRIDYRTGTGTGSRNFTALYTHHGPVMARRNGQWLSVRADNRIAGGLMQCWLRNKASSFAGFKQTLDLKGNISNNTVYADAEGNIAYWHGNRIPRRDTRYNWNKPVDGSISATEWKGYHPISEIVQCINPPNGWLQNCNSTPYTVAGINSPKKENYPAYMAPDAENFRGLNAVRTLGETSRYDIDKVIRAGYDTRLAAFEVLVPALVRSFEKYVSYSDSLYALLIGPVSVLKHWDYRCGENSIATTLAVEWGQRLIPKLMAIAGPDDLALTDQVSRAKRFAETAKTEDLLWPLLETVHDLEARFGRWQMPWGQINRFQRISGDIENRFDDSKPGVAVAFASSAWGMLPSYISRRFPGTQKRYGEHGNSFICAVEFGPRVKAKSLLAGGQSGQESSPHFFDQGEMYARGRFKEVLFYRDEVMKQAERTYHPGE